MAQVGQVLNLIELRDKFESLIIYSTGINDDIFDNFHFNYGATPLSHIKFPVITVAAFCIGIPLLQRFMKNRHSPPLKLLILFHNVFLCVGSAVLAFYLLLNILIFRGAPYHYSPMQVFCNLNYYDQQGRLTLIYYLNHLLKYYELLDTIFLVLKHKNISFLHGYHHPATLVLTWGQLVDNTGIQWFIIFLNLCVHTVMYFYYAMSTLRIRMPWKKIVTVFQILQFVIGIWACYYSWAIWNFYGVCYGTPRAAASGCFILTSYLYLFVDFYNETYGKKKTKKVNQEKKDK